MSTRNQPRPLQTVYLIPGFMSPAWMMYPMQLYMANICESVVRWDYPRVFVDLDKTISSLAGSLDEHPERSVSIVAHSFGDWIVRSALNHVRSRSVRRLVSVCPVIESVALARFAQHFTGDLIPEFAVMANDARASVTIPDDLDVERTRIWARGEALLTTPAALTTDRRVWASHNSVLFQLNVWKVIVEELCRSAGPQQ